MPPGTYTPRGDRGILLPEHYAALLLDFKALFELFFVEFGYVCRRGAYYRLIVVGERTFGFVEFGSGNFKAVCHKAVEFEAVLFYRLVAALRHVGDDALYHLFVLAVVVYLAA